MVKIMESTIEKVARLENELENQKRWIELFKKIIYDMNTSNDNIILCEDTKKDIKAIEFDLIERYRE